MLRSMAWHMLILMSGVIKGPRALTEEHSAGDPNPGEEGMINDDKMFWEQETSDGLSNIGADEFFSFLKVADSLGIHGDT
jgi:hypothetical protein